MPANTSGETVDTKMDGVPKSLRVFPQISGDAFQHPDDREASNAIQALPLFPEIYRFVRGSYVDQMMRMGHLTEAIRISSEQGANLYSKFVLAARILDVQQLPELYLDGSPEINAYAGGLNRPIVSLNRGILSMLSEGELMAIIGHELGHVKCRHGLNQSLVGLFASAGVERIASAIPVLGTVAAFGVKAALSYWSRMAEFSCDRAALLVVQDPQIVATALAKLAGFQEKIIPDFNFPALLRQIEDYEKYDQNTMQAILKLQKIFGDSLQRTHPLPVLRVKRILDWGKSDHYTDIMNGDYVRDTGVRPPPLMPDDSPKCSQCGRFMETGATFCSHCGSRL